jgi:RNA polymerase sigma-70 factor (ECF subfamily)
VDEWRKHTARRDSFLNPELIPASNPGKRLYTDLEELLFRLGEDEREVIVLKTIDGLTFREIAAISDASMNTVASRYRRALEKLKHMLQEGSP